MPRQRRQAPPAYTYATSAELAWQSSPQPPLVTLSPRSPPRPTKSTRRPSRSSPKVYAFEDPTVTLISYEAAPPAPAPPYRAPSLKAKPRKRARFADEPTIINRRSRASYRMSAAPYSTFPYSNASPPPFVPKLARTPSTDSAPDSGCESDSASSTSTLVESSPPPAYSPSPAVTPANREKPLPSPPIKPRHIRSDSETTITSISSISKPFPGPAMAEGNIFDPLKQWNDLKAGLVVAPPSKPRAPASPPRIVRTESESLTVGTGLRVLWKKTSALTRRKERESALWAGFAKVDVPAAWAQPSSRSVVEVETKVRRDSARRHASAREVTVVGNMVSLPAYYTSL